MTNNPLLIEYETLFMQIRALAHAIDDRIINATESGMSNTALDDANALSQMLVNIIDAFGDEQKAEE